MANAISLRGQRCCTTRAEVCCRRDAGAIGAQKVTGAMARWRLLLALTVVSAAVAADGSERDLLTVTKRLNALDSWLDDAGKRLAAGQREIASADRRIAKSAKAIRDLDERIRQGGAQLTQLRGDGRILEERRERQAAQLAEHLRAAWRMSPVDAGAVGGKARDVLKLLLNDEDPVVVERMFRYHGYLAKARLRAMHALRETTTAAAGNRAERTRTQRELQAARAAAAKERQTLLAQRTERQRSVAKLRTELADKGRERERLAADQTRLQHLVTELAQRDSGTGVQQGAARAGGEAAWPVQGRLARRFGQPRAGGRMRWQGIYIQATLGAKVRSVAGGEVVFADWLRGFGMLIIVDHGAGRMSLYGHADALFKRLGDRVEAGEVIASVGRSGGQDEAGLYLEVRQDGAPVDPLGWLRQLRG